MEQDYVIIPDIDYLKEKLLSFQLNVNIQSVLIFMANENHLSNTVLKSAFNGFSKPIIGGIFPELIYKGERKKTGMILWPLTFVVHSQLFDLSGTEEEFEFNVELMAECQNDYESDSSVFVFVDAFANNKELFIESLFNVFGNYPTYFGGGAGSLSFKSFPCVINNEGLHANSAVIGWTRKNITLGVAHGWEPITEHLKVTKASTYRLEGINWKPAFEVYKEIVEAHSGKKFTDDNFFDLAMSYPLGVSKVDSEMVIRVSYSLENNALCIIDAIKEGEYVKIMHGNMDSLLSGAKKAYNLAFSKYRSSSMQDSLCCIDCISRVLFMEDSFSQELDAIGGKDVSGILSVGEIANAEGSFLEIYNKTIALALW